MNYLAIDTGGKNLTVIVNNNGKIFKYYDKECGVNHSVALMPKIEEMLSEAQLNLKDADFVACVVGAGSFTGIRIGVATAKALASAFKIKVLPITSFDCIAYNKTDGKVLAVIDAKHNGYYVCGYDCKKVVFPPEYVSGEELKELAKEFELLSGEAVSGFDTQAVDVCEGLVSAIADKKVFASENVNELVPLYVRKSQAEEGR